MKIEVVNKENLIFNDWQAKETARVVIRYILPEYKEEIEKEAIEMIKKRKGIK